MLDYVRIMLESIRDQSRGCKSGSRGCINDPGPPPPFDIFAVQNEQKKTMIDILDSVLNMT